MYIGLHVKYPLFLPEFNATLIFRADFRNISQYKKFMKISTVGVVLFHGADGQTDMMKIAVA
jgi:hypothetical protein